MTKARDIADFKFENIVDTGTEGTKVASGTTAQRGSTTGQWRYNTDTGFFEGRNTDGTFSSLEPTPTIISSDTSEVDSQAGGNITIRVTGTNFVTGGTIKFRGSDATEITASTSSFINASTYDATIARSSFVNSKEPYDIRYISSTGLIATLDNVINVDSSPTWTTSSGSLGNVNEGSSVNLSVSATDADGDTIAYSETGGTVLSSAGFSLNSSTGAITGTAPSVSSDTTYSFNLRATANTKTVDRAFSFVVKDLYGLPSAYQTFVNGRTSGTVYYVSSSQGSDSNNGTSKSTPFQTLAKCAETVGNNDTVVLAPETFTLTGNHYGMGEGYYCISAYKGTGTTGITTEKTNVWFVGHPNKTKVITKDLGSQLRDHHFCMLSSSSGALGIIMERELFGGSSNFSNNYMYAIFKGNDGFQGSGSTSTAPYILNCVLKNASQSPTLSGDSADLGVNKFSWVYDNPLAKHYQISNSTIHNANQSSWDGSYNGQNNAVDASHLLLSGSYANESQVSLSSVESGQTLNTTNWHRNSQTASQTDTNNRGVYSGTYNWAGVSYPSTAFSGNW